MNTISLQSVRGLIISKVQNGEIIDVETFCSIIQPHFGYKTHQQLQHEILRIVSDAHGAAEWGGDNAALKGPTYKKVI